MSVNSTNSLMIIIMGHFLAKVNALIEYKYKYQCIIFLQDLGGKQVLRQERWKSNFPLLFWQTDPPNDQRPTDQQTDMSVYREVKGFTSQLNELVIKDSPYMYICTETFSRHQYIYQLSKNPATSCVSNPFNIK